MTFLLPKLAALTRRCTKDYPVPGTNYTIPKGLRLSIPPIDGCFKNQGIGKYWIKTLLKIISRYV